MAVGNRIANMAETVASWRRDLHAHPELLFDVHRTAGVVAEKLREFGCDSVVTGIGGTGVVGVVRGARGKGATIGLRADMDALPITEATGAPYASQTPGLMHACGHDGHTAMLLGAARYLCETRNFAGSAVLIFQPAEEGGGGGKAMVDDGLMERFGVEQVFGLHNAPGVPIGCFAIRRGPIMAAADRFFIEITGVGGHAATPHLCVDPLLVGAQIVSALQAIAAREVDPLDSIVVSTTQFHAGSTENVIAPAASLSGTIRTLRKETRAFAEKRLHEIAEGIGKAHRADVQVRVVRGYPVTVNHEAETEAAIAAARDVAGQDKVITEIAPLMGAEDFSYMLEARPGAFIFMGNGPSAGLHHPQYDFDDAAIPFGMSYWARLTERLLSAGV
ncbi:MAG: amidohydrolase [Hyphomicrobiales bacterium]|nr:amidohydrolase [Hyphomicrobiales bacterium]